MKLKKLSHDPVKRVRKFDKCIREKGTPSHIKNVGKIFIKMNSTHINDLSLI
jgi:hypothetical protein